MDRREDDGHKYDVLKITPRGGKTIRLWIDVSTHLIARKVEPKSDEGPEVTYFSDYRTVSGVKVPFTREVSGAA